MYEELVKRLRSECALPYSAIKDMRDAANAVERLQCFNALWQEAAIIAHEREPKWIPVTERLPEESWERVLAYTDDGTVMTLPAIKLRNGYVRYWMPLPEPPKEE